MVFSRAGVVTTLREAYRAHVQWRQNGVLRHIYGPRRSDNQAAQQDLDSMREAANGLNRAEGFAAMQVEAKRLLDGKAPLEQGSVTPYGDGFAARIRWMGRRERV